jgi:N-acylneuraminate cytidylyltransferase/CMP-N,N'-diacetyllegionaminic acid synthase
MPREILAIIPARGGSKSIKKKNIAPLGGKPLVHYILKAMNDSRYVTRTVVSTEDTEIAEVCRQCGADVPFERPMELAQDDTPTTPVLEHAVQWLVENEGYKPDIIVLSQPTSPFLRADQIDSAVALLERHPDADAVTTVIEVEHNYHPFNIREIRDDGSVDFIMPTEHDLYPTRQSKPKYYAFGNCYVFRYRTLVEMNSIYGKHCLPLVIDAPSAFDINDPHELAIAETMMAMKAK